MVLKSFILFKSVTEGTVKRYKRKFLDSLRLYVRGGPGGFGHPKYGGKGGDGGSVFAIGKDGATLINIITKNPGKRVSGGLGENSHPRRILGASGNDVIIECPLGVSVLNEAGRKLGPGEVTLSVENLAEIYKFVFIDHKPDPSPVVNCYVYFGEIDAEGDRVMLARGGSGGTAQSGYSGGRGETSVVVLDLKLIADVGLVGFPNAGKSTLLAAISHAKPKIASYPFTTMEPQLGIIAYPDLRQITVADLPGLIEGAHVNIGLGHRFLKHVERTKLLLLVVDVGGFKLSAKHSPRSCLETIILLNKELELYKAELLNKPAMLVVNKMDTEGASGVYKEVESMARNLQDMFEDVPENIRPVQALNFERIIGISAKHEIPHEIEEVKKNIRDILDSQVSSYDVESEDKLLQNIRKNYREHGPALI